MTDDDIMRMLCCGGKCRVGPNTGKCYRWDYTSEAKRVRELIDRCEEVAIVPTAIVPDET